MAANSKVLKIIVEACCRSLSYYDREQQYVFTFNSSLETIWEGIRPIIKSYDAQFYLSDFNRVLFNIENAITLFHRISLEHISDAEIMNGEILEIDSNTNNNMVLTKMKAGQYLNVDTGQGISLGSSFQFETSQHITTSEGMQLGECKRIYLRIPRKEHIVLSNHYLGNYFQHKIADSLWPIVDIAGNICYTKDNECGQLLAMAQNSGINTYSLLNILKGASNYYARNSNHHQRTREN